MDQLLHFVRFIPEDPIRSVARTWLAVYAAVSAPRTAFIALGGSLAWGHSDERHTHWGKLLCKGHDVP